MKKIFYFIGRCMVLIKVLFLMIGPLLLFFYSFIDVMFRKNYNLSNISVIVYTLVYFQFLYMAGFRLVNEHLEKELSNPQSIINNTLVLFLLNLLFVVLALVGVVVSHYL